MKICFIHNDYSGQLNSGAERVVKSLAEDLASKGHEITIIACGKAAQIEEKKIEGLRVIYLPSKFSRLSSWPTWKRLLYHVGGFINLAAYSRLKSIIEKEKFDLIWTHNLIGFGFLSFKALGNAKKLHTCHDVQLLHPSGLLMYKKEKLLDSFQARMYQMLCRFVFPQDALIIFPSHWLESLFYQYKMFKNNKKISIKNPLREQKIFPKHQNDIFSFLYLGQLEKHKGVKLLLNTFKKLASQNCKLLIAGNGSLLIELKQNNDSRISFLGTVKNPEELIAQADCLIVPSLCYENLPTAALEAATQATPVIGSQLGGLIEAIGDPRLLFEPTENDLLRMLEWSLANQHELQKIAGSVRQSVRPPELTKYLETIGKAAQISF